MPVSLGLLPLGHTRPLVQHHSARSLTCHLAQRRHAERLGLCRADDRGAVGPAVGGRLLLLKVLLGGLSAQAEGLQLQAGHQLGGRSLC